MRLMCLDDNLSNSKTVFSETGGLSYAPPRPVIRFQKIRFLKTTNQQNKLRSVSSASMATQEETN